MLKFYNTLTNKKEEFKPLQEGEVSMYNCGPTVYSFAHIGNFSSYIMADLIRRYLEYLGYKVKQIKNITDVGHLVSDADEGEDKLEKAAREEKKDPYAIARFYEEKYLEDENKLKILEPFARPRATEHVQEMIEIVDVLVKKGYAYETDDGIYFDVEKFADYGELSGNTLDKVQAGKRVEVNENKKNPYDFALWKKLVGENTNHIMKWDSPWGEGFPGWHIECSAMSRKYLGDQMDIHTGGEDNIFPHHECEIAQSEAFSGKQFVKYWIHKRHFYVDGAKMSKSLGNIYTLKDIEEMGFDALDLRYLFLSAHYRSKLNFTKKGLADVKSNRLKLENFLAQLRKVERDDSEEEQKTIQDFVSNTRKDFETAMNDDLNTSAAFATIFDLLKYINKKIDDDQIGKDSSKIVLDFMKKINDVFMVMNFSENNIEIPEEIKKLADERQLAREEKDFAKADQIRDQLKERGYELRDNPKGGVEISQVK